MLSSVLGPIRTPCPLNRQACTSQVDLPLIWIATEPLLTLFSRELKPIEPEPRHAETAEGDLTRN